MKFDNIVKQTRAMNAHGETGCDGQNEHGPKRPGNPHAPQTVDL